MKILELHKNSFAILLLALMALMALMALVMLPGCSTTDEESTEPTQEDSSEGTCEQSEREWPACLPL